MNTNLKQSLLPHMDLLQLYTHIYTFNFETFTGFFSYFSVFSFQRKRVGWPQDLHHHRSDYHIPIAYDPNTAARQ
jgi:hypothetical protein